MNLTPLELYHLFTHFPELENTAPLSVHPSDNPIHRVRVVPFAFAERLRIDDPNEDVFHLEFFPKLSRADVWSSVAWKESLSRILKLKAAAREADPSTPLIEELSYLEEEVKVYLIRIIKLPYKVAAVGAHTILCADLTEDQAAFIALLNLPPTLTTRISNAKCRLAALGRNHFHANVERRDPTGENADLQNQDGVP